VIREGSRVTNGYYAYNMKSCLFAKYTPLDDAPTAYRGLPHDSDL
jgi:hypothetical protein